MSTSTTIIIIVAVIAILFSVMYIMSAKDKAKAFSRLLIILFLVAGVISIFGYILKYTPIKEIIEKTISILK